MKHLILLFSILPLYCLGQLQFKVTKVEPKVWIIPNQKGLVQGSNNIQLKYRGYSKIDSVVLQGGQVNTIGNNCYQLIPDKNKGILYIYAQLHGKSVIALTKEYLIIKESPITVYLDGVQPDSTINEFKMVALGYLQVGRSNKPVPSMKVVEFSMQGRKEGTWQKMTVQKDQMSLEMKRTFKNNANGRAFTLYSIKAIDFKNPSDTIFLPPARFFLEGVNRKSKIGL